MKKSNHSFDWKQLLNLDSKNIYKHAFDERFIYREIKKRNTENKALKPKVYLLSISYDPKINLFYYAEILSRFFCIAESQISEHIYKLKEQGSLEWNNLSSSIADLLVMEIQKYLTDKNIKINIITKKVEEYAIKKPGNDFA